MKFLECDLEEIILKMFKMEPEAFRLDIKGLKIGGEYKIFDQLRIGNYGIADIVTIKRPLFSRNKNKYRRKHTPLVITVYELKKDKISMSSYLQAVGYCRGIISYMESVRGFYRSDFVIRIILVGRTIDENSEFIYLSSITNPIDSLVSFYIYDYGLDGIKFEIKSNYTLDQEGF